MTMRKLHHYRSVSKPYFVEGYVMRDERGQRNRGLGGSNDAHFQAIVVAPAGCCCASKINVGDIGERVGVNPIERTILGNVVGGKRGRRRQGCQIGYVDIFCIFCRGQGFFGCEMWPRAGKIRSDLKKVNASWSL
jgi:hypothetical protein